MESRPGWELSMWRMVLVEISPGGELSWWGSHPGGRISSSVIYSS